jgi:hypothetical protein
MKQNYDFFRSYLGVVSREPVSITYLKEEDKFALYYPSPKLSTASGASSGNFGQQCFKFDYYDMIFSISKLRDEIWANRSKFYKEKTPGVFSRGKLLADILSGMFGYRCNDCLIVIFDRFCISKTILDKCYTLRKKKGGVRKIELKMREK